MTCLFFYGGKCMYYKEVSIPGGTADLLSVLFRLNIINDTDLGSHAQSNGYDIQFKKQGTGGLWDTVIPHSRIEWGIVGGVANGRFDLLLDIPTTGVTVRMYYGQTAASDNQNRVVTYANYLAVLPCISILSPNIIEDISGNGKHVTIPANKDVHVYDSPTNGRMLQSTSASNVGTSEVNLAYDGDVAMSCVTESPETTTWQILPGPHGYVPNGCAFFRRYGSATARSELMYYSNGGSAGYIVLGAWANYAMYTIPQASGTCVLRANGESGFISASFAKTWTRHDDVVSIFPYGTSGQGQVRDVRWRKGSLSTAESKYEMTVLTSDIATISTETVVPLDFELQGDHIHPVIETPSGDNVYIYIDGTFYGNVTYDTMLLSVDFPDSRYHDIQVFTSPTSVVDQVPYNNTAVFTITESPCAESYTILRYIDDYGFVFTDNTETTGTYKSSFVYSDMKPTIFNFVVMPTNEYGYDDPTNETLVPQTLYNAPSWEDINVSIEVVGSNALFTWTPPDDVISGQVTIVLYSGSTLYSRSSYMTVSNPSVSISLPDGDYKATYKVDLYGLTNLRSSGLQEFSISSTVLVPTIESVDPVVAFSLDYVSIVLPTLDTPNVDWTWVITYGGVTYEYDYYITQIQLERVSGSQVVTISTKQGENVSTPSTFTPTFCNY